MKPLLDERTVCFSPSLSTNNVMAARWAEDISSGKPSGLVYVADAFIQWRAALRGAVPSWPHRCAVLLLRPLFRGLCWLRHSFPFFVGSVFCAWAPWRGLCRVGRALVLRSHDQEEEEEEVMGEKSRQGGRVRDHLVLQHSVWGGRRQIVTLCPKLHLRNAALPRSPKSGRRAGAEGAVSSRKSRAAPVVGQPRGVSSWGGRARRCQQRLLSQGSSPLPVLQHRVVS